ncbi:regulatory protein, luxR family [Micromonospora citrea]|uniref:Regulatory protein, luxR family n=1 Tax=Micromonospora citrea TaxID=47855 RepID=A0A1C6TUR0_9ACTN|nr:regulatory protein, luxR family [Micromonospora citrea]
MRREQQHSDKDSKPSEGSAFAPGGARREQQLLRPPPAVLDDWAALPAEPPLPGRASPVDLDPEEQRLLRAIAAGRSTVEIAEQMHASERTVRRMTAAQAAGVQPGRRGARRPCRPGGRLNTGGFAGRLGRFRAITRPAEMKTRLIVAQLPWDRSNFDHTPPHTGSNWRWREK